MTNTRDRFVRFETAGSLTIAGFACREIAGMDETETILKSLERKIGDPEFQDLLIDFSGVEFVASCTINMLLIVLKRVRMRGGEMYLCGLSDGVRQVFEIMELSKLFKIWPTRELAIRSLSEASD